MMLPLKPKAGGIRLLGRADLAPIAADDTTVECT